MDNSKTFYEILNVKNDATLDEIKKNYRSLALKYHPDKNLDNIEETTRIFNRIQEAYEILSDQEKRNWYDNHPDVFHKDEINISEYIIDEKYFQSSCYDGFDDDNVNNFYSVYGQLFEQIIQQELRFYDDPDDFEYPKDFGDSEMDLASIKYFYDMWQSFKTSINFNQLDKYDLRQAPNRRFCRFMEKENEKIREQARKQRNATIQKLVKWLRNRDKRMKKYAEYLNEKNMENRRKSEQQRRKKIKENLQIIENYVEQNNDFQLTDDHYKELESNIDNDEHTYSSSNKRNKKKRKNKKKNESNISNDETVINDKEEIGDELDTNDIELIETKFVKIDFNDSCDNETSPDNENNSMTINDIDADKNVNDDDYDDDDLLYICNVCNNKNFKSKNSYNNHLKSKKHLQNVRLYVRLAANDID